MEEIEPRADEPTHAEIDAAFPDREEQRRLFELKRLHVELRDRDSKIESLVKENTRLNAELRKQSTRVNSIDYELRTVVVAAAETVGTSTVTDAELIRILSRAGVPGDDLRQDFIRLFRCGESWSREDDHQYSMIAPRNQVLVFYLLRDAVREDRRWTRRVKLVEARAQFAISGLRGDHDDDL